MDRARACVRDHARTGQTGLSGLSGHSGQTGYVYFESPVRPVRPECPVCPVRARARKRLLCRYGREQTMSLGN